MLYGGMDIETAKLGKSRCRNAAIAEAFHYMHIVETWGTGIPRIINQCKEYGLPDPSFEEFGDGFKVTLFRKVGNDDQKVNNENKKVSDPDQKVFNAFDTYECVLKETGTTKIFIENIRDVYEHSIEKKVFGQSDVMAR